MNASLSLCWQGRGHTKQAGGLAGGPLARVIVQWGPGWHHDQLGVILLEGCGATADKEIEGGFLVAKDFEGSLVERLEVGTVCVDVDKGIVHGCKGGHHRQGLGAVHGGELAGPWG